MLPVRLCYKAYTCHKTKPKSNGNSPLEIQNLQSILWFHPVSLCCIFYFFQEMIYAANHYRLAQAGRYHSDAQVVRIPEFIPWTSSTGPRGLRSVIHRQVRRFPVGFFLLVLQNFAKLTSRSVGYELKCMCVMEFEYFHCIVLYSIRVFI